MATNRLRYQYKNVADLLRRLIHVHNDYDVFVIVEESVEAARYKAAFNARKFFDVSDENLVSWKDWLDNTKTKAHVLGYSSKTEGIKYKGYNDYNDYNDYEAQPQSLIQKYKEKEGNDNYKHY